VRRIVRDFHKHGGYISTIDVTQRQHDIFDRYMWRSLHGSEPYQPSPLPDFYKETARSFGEIAKNGGGEIVVLGQDQALMRSIFELTFGSRWKVEMAKFMNELS
jgi:hypothetical protein